MTKEDLAKKYMKDLLEKIKVEFEFTEEDVRNSKIRLFSADISNKIVLVSIRYKNLYTEYWYSYESDKFERRYAGSDFDGLELVRVLNTKDYGDV